MSFRPIPSATCTLQTRKQVPRGAFFFMCQRGLQGPSALRRLACRARSVSERPPSLSTRLSLSARRVQNPNRFQRTDGIALRPCFAGSGLSQSRWRRDTRGVFVGMSWKFCAKSLMTNAVSAPSLAQCQIVAAGQLPDGGGLASGRKFSQPSGFALTRSGLVTARRSLADDRCGWIAGGQRNRRQT